MSYTAVKFEQFSGLNVNADPEEVGGGGAIDIKNIDPAEFPTKLVPRAGFAKLNTTAIASIVLDALHLAQLNLVVLATAGSPNVLRVVQDNGTSVATQNIGGSGFIGPLVAQGTPTGVRVYCLGDTAYRTDLSTFTAVAAAPVATYASVTPVDNRLVAGPILSNDPSGAGIYQSRVRFSDAGDGDTWGTNNYVDLHPGDGCQIIGIAAWHNDIYVLKDSGALFRFYGTSTDATGNPVFNYQEIRQDVGSPVALAAGDDGVYVVGAAGVFRSRGGSLERVSLPIDPILTGASLPFWQGQAIGTHPLVPVFAGGRLYVLYGAAATYGLVYCPRTDAWSYYEIPLSYSGTAPIVSTSLKLVAGTGTTLPLICSGTFMYRPTGTTDNAIPIASAYRTGFYDLGATEEKRIREALLEGTGTVTYKQSRDWRSLDTGTSVTLGAHPTPSGGRARKAFRGRLFSHQLSGSGTWSINRVVQNVVEKRPVGVEPTA